MAIEVSQNQKDFNCDNCKNSFHCTETKNDPLWPNSIGPAEFEILEVAGIIDSRVCLKPMITSSSYFYLRLYEHYKNGLLPFSGGLLDQPAVFIETMEVMSRYMPR